MTLRKSDSMRILFVTNDTTLSGGTANSFLTILDNLPKTIEQVYVLMHEKGTLIKFFAERKISIWVMEYGSACTNNSYITMEDMRREWNNIKCAWKLAKRLQENNIDIVYTNSGIIDVGAMAALFAGKKHIWHQREFIHQHFKKKYILEWKVCWLLNYADTVVTISKCLLKELRKKYHIRNGIVLYNKFNKQKYYTERENFFSSDVLMCLVTGTMYEGKHQLDAVHAVGKLIRRCHMPIELYLVGGGEGEYINQIRDLIKEYGVQEKIHILQYEEDMKSLRERMDIEISCSQWEAFGRVVIEGMLSGLLVVGANSGATPELIKHNKNGLLYRPGDVDDLTEKILWIYSHRQEAKKIAVNGQKWADKLYTDAVFEKELENIIMNTNRRIRE